mmetsp:Transcript_31900/g.53801  ORF Transcript_31900/g.53801 Transcript_31900/m.53801 type:complete len:369 (+) Transcript_31900:111-1217(+)
MALFYSKMTNVLNPSLSSIPRRYLPFSFSNLPPAELQQVFKEACMIESRKCATNAKCSSFCCKDHCAINIFFIKYRIRQMPKYITSPLCLPQKGELFVNNAELFRYAISLRGDGGGPYLTQICDDSSLFIVNEIVCSFCGQSGSEHFAAANKLQNYAGGKTIDHVSPTLSPPAPPSPPSRPLSPSPLPPHPIETEGMRFILGIAEAGFFPGIIFYLTRWFTPRERASRLAILTSAHPIAGVLGGLLAYFILGMDGYLGFKGWQWLFILEGFPSILAGFATLALLPESPAYATWLTEKEKALLAQHTTEEGSTNKHANDHSWEMIRKTLGERSVWIFAIIDFLFVLNLLSVVYFLPGESNHFRVWSGLR